MKKNKIITGIVIFASLLCAISILAIVNSRANNPEIMKTHLSQKYGIDKNEIKVLEYIPQHLDTDFGFFGLDATNTMNYVNRKWRCEYKNREFIVEYYNLKYMDDYQLEDIFNWCTEYLQENYDEEIVGVEVYSDIIYHSPTYDFDYELPWGSNKVFNKNDAKDLLNILSNIKSIIHQKSITVFYETEDLYKYADVDSRGLFCLEKDRYYEFRTEKEMKLLYYGDCNIVVTTSPKFIRSDIGIGYYYSSAKQTNISIKDNKNYVFKPKSDSL